MVGGCSARSRAQSAKAFASDEANLHSLPAIYEGSWLPQSPASRQCRAAEAANQGTEDPEREGMNSGSHKTSAGGEGGRGRSPTGVEGRCVERGGRRALTAAEREQRVADKAVQNQYTAELAKVRKVLQKVRMEHALLEAYAADGWGGASREKVKPTAELERARAKVAQCQQDIRLSIKVMDEMGGDTAIDIAHYDSDGGLAEEHIFCAKCRMYESTDDNDIILCDGDCRRAYHQKCVEPPIDLEAIGEDDPWLCPACDAKDNAAEFINAEFGTSYTLSTPWAEFFAEEPTPPACGNGATGEGQHPEGSLLAMDLPTDEEDDLDFDAEGEGGDSDEEASSSSEGEPEGEKTPGSSSGQEDEDKEYELRMLREEAEAPLVGEGGPSGFPAGELVEVDRELAPILTTKRKRSKVDYRALNQEMFGDFESYDGECGDDGDWGPGEPAGKRNRRVR